MSPEAVALHYELQVGFHEAGYAHPFSPFGGGIRVECGMLLRSALFTNLNELTFIIHRLLKVRRVTYSDGAPLAFVTRLADFEGIENLQVRTVTVTLPEAVSPQQTFSLRFEYDGVVAGHCEAMPYCKDSVSRGFCLLRAEVMWYPAPALPSMESWRAASTAPPGFTYDLAVKVPHTLIDAPLAVAAGDLISATGEDGASRYSFRCMTPSRRIDLVVAPYRESKGQSGSICVFSLPGDEQSADRVMWTVEKTKELCTRWLGPVPPRGLSIAEIPDNWGSQSSPRLILQVRRGFVSAAVTGTPPGSLPKPEWRQFMNLAHEVAHLWSVTSLEPVSSRWLDEGMTHFVESLLLRQVFGEEAYRWRIESLAKAFNEAPEEARSQPICGNTRPEFTEVLSRCKGPWSLMALCDLVGLENGLAAMRAFTQKYLDTGATPRDFIDVAARAVAGTAVKESQVRALLTEWLFETSVKVIESISGRA